jgi:hypothetical protein
MTSVSHGLAGAKARPVLIALLAGMLVVAVVVISYGELAESKAILLEGLAVVVPPVDQLGNWRVSHRPLAESEEMQRNVEKTLNFDEAVFSDYTDGSRRVAIYLAYWRPDKMPHRLVAKHTPDVCWVQNGWNCLFRDKTAWGPLSGNERALQTEHRIFQFGAKIEHVEFVHLVGTRPMRYGTSGETPWYAVFLDLINWGLDQRKEQLLVRISSDRPYSEFKDYLPVRLLVERISALYLNSE